MKRAVVDASVVLKWYLPDEELGEKAMGLLRDNLAGRTELVAPTLLEYEVVNSLVIAGRRGRIGEGLLRQSVAGFVDLQIPLLSLAGLHEQVVGYCERYRCTAYDASYLALAAAAGLPFVTADDALVNRVKKHLNWVKRLSDL